MSEPVSTLEGWYMLHDFRTIDWSIWSVMSTEARSAAIAEATNLFLGWERIEHQREGSTGIYSIAGNKADLLLLNLRPTLNELNDLKHQFNKTRLSRVLTRGYSYVSVIELSGYLAPPGVPTPEQAAYLKSRLEPALPKTEAVCFYPMNKRRAGTDNWYMLPREERVQLMRAHGQIGHRYREQITQIISGSQGLDDWEWGVTLFADDPVQFKKIVYEMRFDEASARFAEFGPFLVGSRLTLEDFGELLTLY